MASLGDGMYSKKGKLIEHLNELDKEISEEDYLRMIPLCQGLEPRIHKRDREQLEKGKNGHRRAFQLFEMLMERGHLSWDKPDVLIKLLEDTDQHRLAEEVKTRFEKGFARHL
ncbi:uncharacterized protein [Ptychodera flava]|uniref:uncharacterized protein n=1 Tax=Ptychodera flava TaxID=63121 RepID=UPI00396AA1A7